MLVGVCTKQTRLAQIMGLGISAALHYFIKMLLHFTFKK